MSEELWYVKLANGDVHRVTLDQLDSAFQAGHIDESTMVLGSDATAWMSLGALLGEDGEGTSESHGVPAARPAAAAEPVPAYTQVQTMQAMHVQVTQPAPAATRAPAYTQPGGYGYTPPVAATPSHASPPQPYGYAQPQTAGTSLRPMSLDLGDASDYDLEYPKRSKKALVAAVFAFAAIAAGVGFVTQRAHRSGGDDIATVAAAAAMAAPHETAQASPPPVAAPTPSTATAVPAVVPASGANAASGGGSPLNPQFTSRFNEEQKTKLLAADKTHEAKAKAKHGGGGASHAAPKASKSTTFTTGGNKFDPLNSSI